MTNIYSFWKKNTNIKNIHSLTRNYFKKDEFISAKITNSHYYIQVKSDYVPCFAFQNPNYSMIPQYKFDAKREVFIECDFSFHNRGSKGEEAFVQYLSPIEAMDKFCKTTGILPVEDKEHSINSLGSLKTRKFTLINIFKIKGYFKIDNLTLFNKALENGIGSRKSYGLGLILIKKIL